jgi:hypothetical protein
MINRIVLGVLALALSGSAAAAMEQAQSIKYFDESGVLVGQQVALCGNFRGSYGNVHTAFHVTEIANCIGRDQHPASIVRDTHITAYTLPSTLTIQQVCAYAHCTAADQPELDVYFNRNEYAPYNVSETIDSGAVVAAPSYGWDRTYYSDASMTVVVGQGQKGCSGKPSTMLWGVQTIYFTGELQPCG